LSLFKRVAIFAKKGDRRRFLRTLLKKEEEWISVRRSRKEKPVALP